MNRWSKTLPNGQPAGARSPCPRADTSKHQHVNTHTTLHCGNTAGHNYTEQYSRSSSSRCGRRYLVASWANSPTTVSRRCAAVAPRCSVRHRSSIADPPVSGVPSYRRHIASRKSPPLIAASHRRPSGKRSGPARAAEAVNDPQKQVVHTASKLIQGVGLFRLSASHRASSRRTLRCSITATAVPAIPIRVATTPSKAAHCGRI